MELQDNEQEIQISSHTREQWIRRRQELGEWVERPKLRRHFKRTVPLQNGVHVDEELYNALNLLQQAGIKTEHSCAGVSLLDEPIDHSLYAYVTFYKSEAAERLISILEQVMRKRVLITFEPLTSRYDVSSFLIGHNRSFCLLLQHAAQRLTLACSEGERS
ncbi:hypothetical protein [Paenibacillus lemnae]|uniref:Uncharacterized protein n=1 Tax=Paenibacillus lemnae TaxID=1330551 RepID=A0A848MCB4_PAELE|nr:hypothetical protein [Paenibacillus lemnae]NMO97869.1 hypothetical protein [Paenibacillus lemnae]